MPAIKHTSEEAEMRKLLFPDSKHIPGHDVMLSVLLISNTMSCTLHTR